MSNSRKRSAYEEGLARAHKSLYWAKERAEELGDLGAVDDLVQLQAHLAMMLEDSIRDRRRPRRQLSLVDS